ncbi:MAG TPA: hypothetical protein VK486_03870 [Thermoleophilaceae bacterium]|nr:hypothetical protein [Thermoleophilaceae bacterium]
MKKELRPVHDAVSCDVCGRTILKGERAEWYLAPGGHRRQVCDLCATRAQQHGWIRESGAGDLPARLPRNEPRRGVMGRLRKRRPVGRRTEDEGRLADGNGSDGVPATDRVRLKPDPEFSEGEEAAPPPRPRSRPQSPRHVRAVPTTAEVKVERALELFNGSGHQRTVAGLARTLGEPWVSAMPDPAQASAVSVLVAWELSWYRYRVDLGDEADPVMMLDKGEELDQIDESLRAWNAALDSDGRLVAAGVSDGGSEE